MNNPWLSPRWEVKLLSEDELIPGHSRLWDVIAKTFPDLPREEWAKIASLVIDTCGECHDAPAGCQCWNDE